MRLIFILLFLGIHPLLAQKLTPTLILEKSIQYHDPQGKLSKGDYTFHFEDSRPDGSVNKTTVQLAPTKERFDLKFERSGDQVEYSINKSEVKYKVNGKSSIPDSTLKKHRISKDRGLKMKDYYLYLWHLPMKLNDPGTIIADKYKYVDFFGHNLLEIKVTYTEEVGKDIWYFYFDPISFRMSGYRFYHDESANDGEYILLSEEMSFENIKLPAIRKWYTHKEDKFLGTDNLVKISTANK